MTTMRRINFRCSKIHLNGSSIRAFLFIFGFLPHLWYMWSTSKPQYDVISKHHYDYGVLEGPLERVVESDPVNETISKPTPVLADNREDNQISRPNILLVVADDLRPQLGLYGGRAQTPHLDELAASPGSMIFERAYAQITVCNPSRASFLSGRRPDHTQIFGFEAGTPSGWTTLPEFMRLNGYTTLGTGKIWHWGPGPPGAWSKTVRYWSNSQRQQHDRSPTWELPDSSSISHESEYGQQVIMPRPSPRREHVIGGIQEERSSFPIQGFWPDSKILQQMKVQEQKALRSTIDPVCSDGSLCPQQNTKDSNALPFRDAIFASRAIQLLDIGEANTCAASNDDENGEACSPWFIAVGFSLPHEPIRFPKKFWDLYETDKTFGASTPHPKRPLGSPIFAYGDLKEKFVFSDNTTMDPKESMGRTGARRRLAVKVDFGPSRPLLSEKGKNLLPGKTKRENFDLLHDNISDNSSNLAYTTTLSHLMSSFQLPPPLPPPDLNLRMTTEEAALKRKRGELGSAYAEKLTTRSQQAARHHKVKGKSGGRAKSEIDMKALKNKEIGSLEVTVENEDYWSRFAASGAWQDPFDHIWEKPMPKAMQLELRRGYAAAVSFMDYQMGRILTRLKDLPNNASERTVIIFTSDHGFSIGDHGGWGKRSLWEPDARVPLIIKVPPRILQQRAKHAQLFALPSAMLQKEQNHDYSGTKRETLLMTASILQRGQRTAAFVELIDLFPTISDLAGLELGEALSDQSRNVSKSFLYSFPKPWPATKLQLRDEPKLDGVSLVPLFLTQGNFRTASRSKESRQSEEEKLRRSMGKKHAITQFPRCPVRYNRIGERKTLVQEPWRTCGAGGFECQGRIGDWSFNHDLALMGYSLRTDGWRYTAWLRVIKGGNNCIKSDIFPTSAVSLSCEAGAFLNWTYPPYATELYRHPNDHVMNSNTNRGSTIEDILREEGGAFDVDENVNIAHLYKNISRSLFDVLKSTERHTEAM